MKEVFEWFKDSGQAAFVAAARKRRYIRLCAKILRSRAKRPRKNPLRLFSILLTAIRAIIAQNPKTLKLSPPQNLSG